MAENKKQHGLLSAILNNIINVKLDIINKRKQDIKPFEFKYGTETCVDLQQACIANHNGITRQIWGIS